MASPDRPPLILVHGAWHGSWVWEEHWAPCLRDEGWQVESIDLSGHGGRRAEGRDGPGWTTGLSRYERDVAQAVGRVDDAPVLVGHSMGGFVVQRIAARRPVAGAVLVGAVPSWGGSGVASRLLVRHPIDTIALAFGDPPDHRRFLFGERLDERTAASYVARLQEEAAVAQLQTSLPRVPRRLGCPVLVVGGAEDALVEPRAQIRNARWHGARAHLFRGMGHDVMLDVGWESVLETVSDWLGTYYA